MEAPDPTQGPGLPPGGSQPQRASTGFPLLVEVEVDERRLSRLVAGLQTQRGAERLAGHGFSVGAARGHAVGDALPPAVLAGLPGAGLDAHGVARADEALVGLGEIGVEDTVVGHEVSHSGLCVM